MNRSASFFASFLFAFFLIAFPLAQPMSAQEDPNKTEHLKPWTKIDFADDPSIDLVQENKHCLIAENTNVPGRDRFRIYFNSEFRTGEALVTDGMMESIRACKPLIRDYISRGHAILFYGTNNHQANNQSEQRPLSEVESSERQTTNDYRLAQMRASVGVDATIAALADVPVDQAGNYVPGKIQTEVVLAPDSLQGLEDLPDRASLEFRKSFFVVIEIYKEGAQNSSGSENRISAMKDDMRDWVTSVHSRIDSLGREHAETRDSVEAALDLARDAQNTAEDAQETAEEANEDESSSGSLNVGYHHELGLHMAQIGFETDATFSVRTALGGSPFGAQTDLCEGTQGVSDVLFGELGGMYNHQFSNAITAGIGLSGTITRIFLEENKGLTAYAAGPDLRVQIRATDRLQINAEAGVNVRDFDADGVTVGENTSRFAVEGGVGITVTL